MDILQNLVHMTGQRDHLRLEFSVLSTLLQLPHVTQVRTLEIHPFEGQPWVRPRTWLQDGQLVNTDIDFLHDPQRKPLSTLPTLNAGMLRKQERISITTADGLHILWLPVWMREQARVCIEITQSTEFSTHDLDILLAIFQVYQNYQSLLDYSERDALTGLLNRKTFDEHLHRFSNSTKAENMTEIQPWLAVIDIDHFKLVNDRYGHLFGDEVLILVANLLRSNFGSQHRVFRFGGEEFVILLQPMSLSAVSEALEHFRQAVQDYEFPQIGKITVSLGFSGAHMRSPSPTELLSQANEALYYAKENGRNRVCHYETLQALGVLKKQEQITHDDVELF